MPLSQAKNQKFNSSQEGGNISSVDDSGKIKVGMPLVISIVGKSKAGKTTILESLIRVLKQRGYRVAVAKHIPQGFELDQPGKDSWRLFQAGGDGVVLSSPQKLAIIKPVEQDATLKRLPHFLGEDVDIILAEGFRGSDSTKIEVHRSGLGELLCPAEELLAIITDEPLEVATPKYSPGNIEVIADFIEERFLAWRSSDELTLLVNGVPIPTNPFVKEIITKTLLGMVSALKGAERVESLRIWLRRGKGDS